MILPDVDVLVFAFRREADEHERYAAWLHEAISGNEEIALVDAVLVGVVRVTTNPRIFADPAPTRLAVEFVDRLRESPAARTVGSTVSAWHRFRSLAEADRHVRGNLVPDAWIAALAITSGARVATADAGFARFPGLRWFDPARR